MNVTHCLRLNFRKYFESPKCFSENTFFENKNIFIDQIHHYDEKGQGKLNTNKCMVKI